MHVRGEFQPPKELVAIEMARFEGPGSLALDATGIDLHGRLVDVPELLPPRILAPLVVLVATASASTLGYADLWIGGSLAVATLILARGVVTRPTRHRVPWSDVEHVVRMPAQPEVVCFVLQRPVGRSRGPETLFFAPGTEDVTRFLASVRSLGPAGLPIDASSALLPSPVPDEAEEDAEP